MTSIYSRCRIHACRRNATSGFQKTQIKPSPSSNQNPRITSIQTYRPHFSGVKRLLPAAVPRAPIRDVTPRPVLNLRPSPFPLLGHVSLKCPLPRSGQSAWTRGKSEQGEASVQRRHFTPSPRPSLGGSPSPSPPSLPGLPRIPYTAPLQPSNSSKSLVRAALPTLERAARRPGQTLPLPLTFVRAPGARHCQQLRQGQEQDEHPGFRGLIAVVLSVASLHRRPMVAPEPRVRVSRSQARGKTAPEDPPGN